MHSNFHRIVKFVVSIDRNELWLKAIFVRTNTSMFACVSTPFSLHEQNVCFSKSHSGIDKSFPKSKIIWKFKCHNRPDGKRIIRIILLLYIQQRNSIAISSSYQSIISFDQQKNKIFGQIFQIKLNKISLNMFFESFSSI